MQYLAIYPRIETSNGLEIDTVNATMQSLNGQSILNRGFGNDDCVDGAPEIVDTTQEYICTEVRCSGGNHGLEQECDCGTWQNGQYVDCTRAYEDCGWQTIYVWSCGGSPDGSNNSGTGSNGGGSGNDDGEQDLPPDEDDDQLITGPFEVEEIEESEISELCDKIAAQIEDLDYIEAKNYLEGKIGEPIEYGKSFNVNGEYNDVAQNPDDGNQLDVQITTKMLGFIHTHLNDVIIDLGNNTIKRIKKYRMFSPKDFKTFLLLLKNASNNDLNTSDVFLTMLSSSGNYTLRFDGNINNLLTAFTPELESYLISIQAENDYKKLIEKYKNERGFLKFIKEQIDVDGISLYEIKNNGTIKQKYLNENEKVKSNKCEQN